MHHALHVMDAPESTSYADDHLGYSLVVGFSLMCSVNPAKGISITLNKFEGQDSLTQSPHDQLRYSTFWWLRERVSNLGTWLP